MLKHLTLLTLVLLFALALPRPAFADQMSPREAAALRALNKLKDDWKPTRALVLILDTRAPHASTIIQHQHDSTSTIPTGSTLKTLMLAAAIEEGFSTTTMAPGLTGEAVVGARTLRDYRANPEMDAADVVARSSNIGMIPAAQHLGDAGVRRWLDALGLMSIKDPLAPGDLVAMAAGIDASASPEAIARAYATLVTGSQRGRQVFSEETVRWARSALEHAVAAPHGTAHRALMSGGRRVGAKTGTAIVPAAGDLPEGTRANLVAVYPIDDPKWIIFITVERPEGGASSGAVTTPALKQLIEDLDPR